MAPQGALVGEADRADLAFPDEIVEGAQRLLEIRSQRRLLLEGQNAEIVELALRPVELVEIDVVGLEAPEAPFQRGAQMGAIEPGFAAANPGQGGIRPGGLGREDHLVALSASGEPAPDDLLGPAIGLGAGRHGIHLRRVPEIDALIEGVVHLAMALGLAVLLAPGHGPEADGADMDIGAAQAAALHEQFSIGREGAGGWRNACDAPI